MYRWAFKPALFALLAIATSALASAASTMYGEITVVNNSNHAAWADISSSYKLRSGWDIEKAVCLAAGGGRHTYTITYRFPSLGPQARVRAEIKPGLSDCGGSNIAVPSAQKDLNYPKTGHTVHETVTISGSNPYSVNF